MGTVEIVFFGVLALAALGFATASIVFVQRAAAASADLKIAAAAQGSLQAVLDAERKLHTDDVERREAVIADFRRTVEETEKALAASSDPAAARARLKLVLAGAAAGDHPAAAAGVLGAPAPVSKL